MISILIAQQLLSTTFMGGSSEDFLKSYLQVAKRSVIVSDRIVNAYGPTRFYKTAKGEISFDMPLMKAIWNPILEFGELGRTPPPTPRPEGYSHVDALVGTTFPLDLIAIKPLNTISVSFSPDSGVGSSGKVITDPPPTINIDLHKTGTIPLVIAAGSDQLRNINDRGFSKKVVFPSLLGKLWYNAYTHLASERDYLNAVAQTASCKLKVEKDQFTFEPDFEKIRTRFLSTYKLFGTPGDDDNGVRQTIQYLVYSIASQDLIRQTISDDKMDVKEALPNNAELVKACQQLWELKVKSFEKSSAAKIQDLAKTMRQEVSDKTVTIRYGYGFQVGLVMRTSDGKTIYL